VFKTFHRDKSFSRRRGKAGRDIDSRGKDPPLRMRRASWCPMLGNGAIASNPSPFVPKSVASASSPKTRRARE
jgi:hypothetical protein